MAKTQEELTQLKNEYETLTTKFQELSEDELKIVAGGLSYDEKIDHVKSLISQIISILSSVGKNNTVQRAISYLNDTIYYLNSGNLQMAKSNYDMAFETLNEASPCLEVTLDSVIDLNYEIKYTINW